MSMINRESDSYKPLRCVEPARKPRTPRRPTRPRPRPASTWDTWTDSDRWVVSEQTTSCVDFSVFAAPVYPRPTEDSDTADYSPIVGPTVLEEAEDLGFRLVMDDEDPAPPVHFSAPIFDAYLAGYKAAWTRRFRDEAESRSLLAGLPEAAREWPFAEAVEAVGVYVARLS